MFRLNVQRNIAMQCAFFFNYILTFSSNEGQSAFLSDLKAWFTYRQHRRLEYIL